MTKQLTSLLHAPKKRTKTPSPMLRTILHVYVPFFFGFIVNQSFKFSTSSTERGEKFSAVDRESSGDKKTGLNRIQKKGEEAPENDFHLASFNHQSIIFCNGSLVFSSSSKELSYLLQSRCPRMK